MRITTTLAFFGILAALAMVPSIAGYAPDAPAQDRQQVEDAVTPAPEGDATTEGCPFQRGEATTECPYKGGKDAGKACPRSGKTDSGAKCPYSGGEIRQAVGTYQT